MSKELDKQSVDNNKGSALRILNDFLDDLCDGSNGDLKKANLISYWIKDYVSYLKFEDTFDPKRNISYKRGDIVKINFGFNVGSEYGGLHYAVVLDNNNAQSSPVVTVIPLTSQKQGKHIHPNDVDLGNELYISLKAKYDALSKSLDEKSAIVSSLMQKANILDLESAEAYSRVDFSIHEYDQMISYVEYAEKENSLSAVLQTLQVERQEIASQKAILDKIGNEIMRMKGGSVALVNLIDTVSKMKIFDPKATGDVLSGIRLSSSNMEKINNKVKQLYIFS